MDCGTATHRLRKLLMFSMAQRLGMTVCFRCSRDIESADDLSIDHKQSWLYVDAALFWSLDNLAFSHKACNKTDRPKLQRKFVPPPGMSWCSGCRDFKPKDQFSPDKRNGSGTTGSCRECRNKNGSHRIRAARSKWIGKKRVTESVLKELILMRKMGMSHRTCAASTGIPRSTIARHLKSSSR